MRDVAAPSGDPLEWTKREVQNWFATRRDGKWAEFAHKFARASGDVMNSLSKEDFRNECGGIVGAMIYNDWRATVAETDQLLSLTADAQLKSPSIESVNAAYGEMQFKWDAEARASQMHDVSTLLKQQVKTFFHLRKQHPAFYKYVVVNGGAGVGKTRLGAEACLSFSALDKGELQGATAFACFWNMSKDSRRADAIAQVVHMEGTEKQKDDLRFRDRGSEHLCMDSTLLLDLRALRASLYCVSL